MSARRDELLALASKLEVATGPDRDLADEIIVKVLGWRTTDGRWWNPKGHYTGLVTPDPTASLDDAMSLAPSDAALHVNMFRVSDKPPVWHCEVTLNDHWVERAKRKDNNLALALCAASLRARAATLATKETDHDTYPAR